MPAPPLVLASASPRRSRILDMLGLTHSVEPSDIPETEVEGEGPEEHVERLARAKAAEVARRRPDALVLAGDTVVALGGRLLGKPADAAEAARMLVDLSGREHTVSTGLALARPGGAGPLSRVDTTRVRFRAFDRAAARAYAATGEPLDKAGGYGIQGSGAALIHGIEGDYYTVVGLPVAGLLALLEEAGYRYRFDGLESSSERDRL